MAGKEGRRERGELAHIEVRDGVEKERKEGGRKARGIKSLRAELELQMRGRSGD